MHSSRNLSPCHLHTQTLPLVLHSSNVDSSDHDTLLQLSVVYSLLSLAHFNHFYQFSFFLQPHIPWGPCLRLVTFYGQFGHSMQSHMPQSTYTSSLEQLFSYHISTASQVHRLTEPDLHVHVYLSATVPVFLCFFIIPWTQHVNTPILVATLFML